MTDTGQASLVELRFSQPSGIDPGRVCERFGEDRAEWLGSPVPSPTVGVRRYLTDLTLPVRAGAPHLIFKKAAFVDVGSIACGEDICEIAISWRSATLAPLFPVFSGRLIVTAGEVRLEGYYAPPGGDVGLVLDKAFLNIAARGTARWFLERVTEVMRDPARRDQAEPTRRRQARRSGAA